MERAAQINRRAFFAVPRTNDDASAECGQRDGIVGAPNHAGKREILMEDRGSGREDDDF